MNGEWRLIGYLISTVLMIGSTIYEKIDAKEINVIQKESIEYVYSVEEQKDEIISEEHHRTVNINTADSEELQTLYRIGPKTAEKIINYRNENGNFKEREDVIKVKGIGPKTYEKIKDSIIVE